MQIDTTVLGGLPVTVEFETTGWDNRDVGLGVNDIDDWYIIAVGGRPCKKEPTWLYNRIKAAGETDRLIEEMQEAA